MIKEEIRIKWIRHTPLKKLDECVDGAMDEYAEQEAIGFFKWNNDTAQRHINYLIDKRRGAMGTQEMDDEMQRWEQMGIGDRYDLYIQSKQSKP